MCNNEITHVATASESVVLAILHSPNGCTAIRAVTVIAIASLITYGYCVSQGYSGSIEIGPLRIATTND